MAKYRRKKSQARRRRRPVRKTTKKRRRTASKSRRTRARPSKMLTKRVNTIIDRYVSNKFERKNLKIRAYTQNRFFDQLSGKCDGNTAVAQGDFGPTNPPRLNMSENCFIWPVCASRQHVYEGTVSGHAIGPTDDVVMNRDGAQLRITKIMDYKRLIIIWPAMVPNDSDDAVAITYASYPRHTIHFYQYLIEFQDHTLSDLFISHSHQELNRRIFSLIEGTNFNKYDDYKTANPDSYKGDRVFSEINMSRGMRRSMHEEERPEEWLQLKAKFKVIKRKVNVFHRPRSTAGEAYSNRQVFAAETPPPDPVQYQEQKGQTTAPMLYPQETTHDVSFQHIWPGGRVCTYEDVANAAETASSQSIKPLVYFCAVRSHGNASIALQEGPAHSAQASLGHCYGTRSIYFHDN